MSSQNPAPRARAASDDAYWATLPMKSFCSEYFSRLGNTQIGGPTSYLSRLQQLAHHRYFGALPGFDVNNNPTSATPTRSGPNGSSTDLYVNWYHSKVNNKHQIIVAPELAWVATAVNTDAKSISDAVSGSNTLEYLWKSEPYKEQATDAVLGALLYGEEAIFCFWEDMAGEQLASPDGQTIAYSGGLKVRNVASWDLFRDSTARSFEDSDWLAARVAVNRWDLIAKYPAFADKIKHASAPIGTPHMGLGAPFIADQNRDRCYVHYFFHKKTPALPHGLQALILDDDTALEFEALEPCYERLPIIRMAIGNMKNSAYPYTPCWDALGIQDLATNIQGAMATNAVAFGKQCIAVKTGTNLNVSAIGNGPYVMEVPDLSQPPVPLNLMEMPAAHFENLKRLEADMDRLLGLNDVAQGQAPTGVPNAEAWSLLASATVTVNSNPQRCYVKFVTDIGRSILSIFKIKATRKQKLAINGVHGSEIPVLQEFNKDTFTGLADVQVEIASALSQTAAGRLQLAQLYTSKGFVQTPEQLQTVVETGKLTPLTQGLSNELIYIQQENESLLKGQSPMVLVTDSHKLHILEHKQALNTMDARSNPAIVEAASQHIQQHLTMLYTTDPRTLMLMGQAVPPPELPTPTQANNEPLGGPPHGAAPAPGLVNHVVKPPLPPNLQQIAGIEPAKMPTDPLTGRVTAPPGKPLA